MSKTLKLIVKRAEATNNAQIAVQADWIWDGKPVLQWGADIQALNAQCKVVSDAEADMKTKRGVYHDTLDDIHARTVQAVAMFKVRYKFVPARLAVVQSLSAAGESEDDIVSEAQSLISDWAELDPAWNPTKDNTLAALTTLNGTTVQTQRDAAGKARTTWRTQAEIMNTQAAELDADSVSWYGAATKVFLAGTADGDMIRGTIPTTTAVNHAVTPAPAPAPATSAK